MKVYTVESNDYDEHGVHAIFSTKELAQKYVNAFDFSGNGGYYVEEWEVDEADHLKQMESKYRWYQVIVYNHKKKEKVVSTSLVEPWQREIYPGETVFDCIDRWVYATNKTEAKQMARKIVDDFKAADKEHWRKLRDESS